MAKPVYLTTISIEPQHRAIHFYTALGSGKSSLKNALTHSVKYYSSGYFDDDFFLQFKSALTEYVQEHPWDGIRKITVLLPDSVVVTDVIELPTLRGVGQKRKLLDANISALYRNYKELRIISRDAMHDKVNTTYAIAAVQKRIVSAIYSACSGNKLFVDTLTFSANAAASGAALLYPKLKNASYLLLDIKDTYSRFVFVASGHVVGSYPLPFGMDLLHSDQVIGEDMLFDHSYTEMVVRTARSKAQALLNRGNDLSGTDDASFVPTMHKIEKTPRVLPQFMQRPAAQNDMDLIYENFRIYVKWALTLIQGNDRLTALGKPQSVYVNFPAELVPLLERVNREAEENGVIFYALPCEGISAQLIGNLELYGGLYPKQMGLSNIF